MKRKNIFHAKIQFMATHIEIAFWIVKPFNRTVSSIKSFLENLTNKKDAHKGIGVFKFFNLIVNTKRIELKYSTECSVFDST